MQQYTVQPGDTISKIVLAKYSNQSTAWSQTLFDCLIRYVALINGQDLSLYDNIDQHIATDPDSLKINQVLNIPDSISEAVNDPVFKNINNGACYALFNTSDAFQSEKKDNKYLWYIGGGLIALGAIYLLTNRKKKRK